MKGKIPKWVIWVIILILLGLIFWAAKDFKEKQIQKQKDAYIQYHNNFRFERRQGMWVTKWAKDGVEYTIPFRFLPRDVVNITVEGELEGFKLDRLYIAHNPDDVNLTYVSLAGTELSLSLGTVFDINGSAACTKEEPGVCPPRPIVSCGEEDGSVILFEVTETPEIILNGTCITIRGNGFDLVRAVDNLLYQLYGII